MSDQHLSDTTLQLDLALGPFAIGMPRKVKKKDHRSGAAGCKQKDMTSFTKGCPRFFMAGVCSLVRIIRLQVMVVSQWSGLNAQKQMMMQSGTPTCHAYTPCLYTANYTGAITTQAITIFSVPIGAITAQAISIFSVPIGATPYTRTHRTIPKITHATQRHATPRHATRETP